MARFQCYRTAESGVRWRLLGGNNRVLGVGVRVHAAHLDALAEIELVRAGAITAAFVIEHADNGSWWWRLADLARSAQGFARRVDAELAAGRFRDRVAPAELDPVLAVFQPGKRGRSSRGRADVWPQRPVG
ncbi:DUF1508 domain-containing protein [Saccharothrix obliqua]|uniref:DUF1508 domain-containing protein n=1 Tax=Saccharothrix obliqua TaxID=2861747 RepID=UPI001C5FB960|nr:DUF1508 domain-containing protein [Saccharothrix obliqua]MBW4716902.1 DUF1508 domain-containing protein [Saccharothrix obliqua]